MSASTSQTTSVYQLKISLIGSRPSIWRRVQFPVNITFYELHKIIIDSMEWCGSYCYAFTVYCPLAKEKISICCTSGFPEEDLKRICAKEARVYDYFSLENNRKMLYEYCGYEWWKFDLILQKIVNVCSTIIPRCVNGKRAAPAEITKFHGGIKLHQDFLKYIQQVDHPDYTKRMDVINEIYKDGFKPEVFDPANIVFEVEIHDLINKWRCSCSK